MSSPTQLLEYTEQAWRLAKIAVAAGCAGTDKKETDDVQSAQACMKIMMGMEYGLSPTIAMKAIHSISGNLTLSYQLIGALIKRSPKYDWKLIKDTHTNEFCQIDFFENGELAGSSTYTKADAERAGLWGKGQWLKNPKNMVFARAMSNGANQFCSEVFGGSINSPDDFGVDLEDMGSGVTLVGGTDEKKSRAPRAKTTTGTSKESTNENNTEEPTKPSTEPTPSPKSESADSGASVAPDAAKAGQTTEQPVKNTTEVQEYPKPVTPPSATAAEGSTDQTSADTQPGEQQLGEILQAGTSNNWEESQIEEWVIDFLQKKGVNIESTETIFATWTWDMVTEAINYVANNPPA